LSERAFIALGTASQVPTRHRNHNGYFVRWDGEGLLFDPGEGTQRQMIYAGVSAPKINRIFVSHFHGDHCLGLAGIIQRLSLDRVKHPVHIYYPASGQQYLERLRHAAIFKEVATLHLHPISQPGVVEDTPRFRIEALKLSHTVEAWGYRLVEPPHTNIDPAKLREVGLSGRIVGQLKRDGAVTLEDGRTIRLEDVSETTPGQVFAFVMDTRYCRNAVRLAEGADLVVCESTYLNSEAAEARERGHMTATDAARVAHEAGARRLVLTHFSQRHPDEQAFVDEAKPIHADVVAVVDGDVVPFPPRRR
jgi:ribonuclease Z